MQESSEEQEIVLDEAVLAAGEAHLHFDLRLPVGYKLSRAAPFELTAYGDGNVAEVPGGSYQLRTGDPSFPITIPLQLVPGAGFLRLVVILYYCEAPAMRLCYYQTVALRAPLQVKEQGGKPEARVVFRLEVPSAPL